MSLLNQNILNEVEELRAKRVWFEEDTINAELVDGRVIAVPLAFYPLLCDTSRELLEDFGLFGDGTGIYFNQLDEYLSVEALVFGRKQLASLKRPEPKKK